MSFDRDYAQLYDHLYAQKDYSGETEFVLSRAASVLGVGSNWKVLDLGCGTARHAIEFARRGHSVQGADLSSEMLNIAQSRLSRCSAEIAARINLKKDDIRQAGGCNQFDAIFCLFHVMNYLHEPSDILAAMQNARAHARRGAAYLFDFWNGPAILKSPPETRERTYEVADTRVRRVSSPSWRKELSRVTVHYDIEITNTATKEITTSSEIHEMRYFFPEEVERWLRLSGFLVIEIAEWMTAAPLSDACFSGFVLALAE